MTGGKTVKEAIGIDVGGTFIKAGRVAEKGELLKELDKIPTESHLGPQHVINQIASAINSLKTEGSDVAGIGMPGLVSTDCSTVKFPPNFPGWEVVNLGAKITVATGIAVTVDNDANCAALGEAKFGAGKNVDSFILATLGTGVGGAIIVNGQLYRGENGGAGEIGHTTIDYRGLQCNCGSFGCVETYIGNKYLVERVWSGLSFRPENMLHALAKTKEELTPMHITQAANDGDAFAREALRESGYCLGVGLANVMGLFDIRTVIIGGGVAQAGELLFEGSRRAIAQFSQPPIAASFHLIPAALGNNAGILGAAALVM